MCMYIYWFLLYFRHCFVGLESDMVRVYSGYCEYVWRLSD